MGNWSVLPQGTQVDAFADHIYEEDPLVERLKDYDVVIGMRERTPVPPLASGAPSEPEAAHHDGNGQRLIRLPRGH
jgi:hypothetical protein